MFIYTYIEREREREIDIGAFARLEGVATDMAFNPEEREIFKV